MAQKVVLIVDDEQAYLEPLRDALQFEGYRVMQARTVDEAVNVFNTEIIHAATIDIMMPPGRAFEALTDSRYAGIFLCQYLRRNYPDVPLFTLTVVTDDKTIKTIKRLGVRYLAKGETSLRTVLELISDALAPPS